MLFLYKAAQRERQQAKEWQTQELKNTDYGRVVWGSMPGHQKWPGEKLSRYWMLFVLYLQVLASLIYVHFCIVLIVCLIYIFYTVYS